MKRQTNTQKYKYKEIDTQYHNFFTWFETPIPSLQFMIRRWITFDNMIIFFPLQTPSKGKKKKTFYSPYSL